MSTRFETYTGNPMSVFFQNEEFEDQEFEADEFEEEGFLSEEEEDEARRGRRSSSRSSRRSSRPVRRRRLSPMAAARRRKLQMMRSRKRRPLASRKPKPKRFPILTSGLSLWPGIFQPTQTQPQPTNGDQKPPRDSGPSSSGPSGSASGPSEGDKSASPAGSEFNRWVQTSLNSILGLNLPVDGVLDVQTRSAIRSFQTKKGLPADGIVGPPTERALSEALSQSSGAAAGAEGPTAGAGAEPQGAPPDASAAAQEPPAGAEEPPAGAGAEEPPKDSELYEFFAQEFPSYETGQRGRQRGMNRRRGRKRGGCSCPQHPSQFRGHGSAETFEYDEAEFMGEDEGEFIGEDEGEFIGEDEGEFVGEDEGEFLGEEEQEFFGEDEREYLGEDEGEEEFEGEEEAEYFGELEAEFVGEDEGEYLGEEEFSLSGLPSSVLSMLRGGLETAGLRLAITFGYRNETQLTDAIFHARHPERLGKKITAGEANFSSLANEWLSIRDTVVRPALGVRVAAAGTGAPSYVPAGPPATSRPVTGAPTTGGLDIVKTRSGFQVARQIAAKVDALIAAAQADGIKLGGGGYRSPQKQIELRRKHCGPTNFDIYEKKSSLCTPPTARPGQSNHERGLAIDFTYNGSSIKSRSSPAFKWLAANASRFGLYNLPSEPWHWSVNGK